MDIEAQPKKPLITGKITKDDLKHLKLSNVKLTNCVLGQGSYGTVYKAEHSGIVCAAKQLDLSTIVNYVQKTQEWRFRGSSRLTKQVEQNFLMECLQHSKLSHPNIVTMLGVFYPTKQAALPFLVMELMEYNLTRLLERSHNILMYVKLSILQDVSRGLCYLHAQNPPIVHQALYSDNILFTTGLTAKIGDIKTGAETVSYQVILRFRHSRNSNDFLPNPHSQTYDLPLNVFSFGCVVYHVITQKWPTASSRVVYCHQRILYPEPKLDDYSVDKYWEDHIDHISDNSLKHLVEACLQRNPKNRPHLLQIHERITSIMTGEFYLAS